MTIFGTRPEAIKMAPLVLELQKSPEHFESIVTVTAQHREMLDQVLDIFGITPDYDLDIMKDRQTLVDITVKALEGLDKVMKEVRPDIVLVHGDTSTTFVASLAAFYNQLVVGHVEAGLRTWNKYSPYPEEMNRQLTGVIADLHFAPTSKAAKNLLAENKNEESIFITGNTAIDALKTTVKDRYEHDVLKKIGSDRLILLTAHRRENLGGGIEAILRGVVAALDGHPDCTAVLASHPNPDVRREVERVRHPRLLVCDPLAYADSIWMLKHAAVIVSDSGGIQEEAPSFGTPVLVARDVTERPEGLQAGFLRLVGSDERRVASALDEVLADSGLRERLKGTPNPYGDGHAAERIAADVAGLLKS